jgi:hypothetical protein
VSSLDDWLEAVAAELGVAGAVDSELLLDLARDVAHGVARPAAPLTSYLLGLAVASGVDLHDAVEQVRALARRWPPA